MNAPKNMTSDEREVVAVVHSARAGDDIAWTRLVRRFDRMLRSIARSYRLGPSDVDDVVQATWLRLFKHIDQVRDPAAIAGWLAKTARREALRVLQAPVREHLTDDPYAGQPSMAETPESDLLDSELRAALARALASLPNRQRRLMTLLAIQVAPDYESISAILAMPVGSIGPTRARSLARLQHHPELQSLRPSAG
jgi:RNA polymerase sigma factor (sigma-70 family)